MSTKLKCTNISRYACSKLSQQRLMTRWAQNHTLRTPRRVSIKTQSLAQPQKADASCPMICHASALSRLGPNSPQLWKIRIRGASRPPRFRYFYFSACLLQSVCFAQNHVSKAAIFTRPNRQMRPQVRDWHKIHSAILHAAETWILCRSVYNPPWPQAWCQRTPSFRHYTYP